LKRLPKENRTLADSLNLDLLALQKEGKLNSTTLTVHDDPVYHSTKRLKHFLYYIYWKLTAIKNLDAEKYQIVFECIDVYKPMMPLQKFLKSLAVRDTMHQKGNYGQKILKDGNEMKQSFYLVYRHLQQN
jgi:hypothetical protein